MSGTPHRAGNVVGPDSAISAAIPSGPFLSVSSAPSAVRSTPSGRRCPVALPAPSQPKTFWDETSQPLSRPSITSGLETSPRHTHHTLSTPVISSGLPLPIPLAVFKTLKGFQTVAGCKAVRPPPPVPRPQNVQPPPLAEGVGGGGIPESPQAVSPDESRSSAIPRRRNKPHRGSLPRANGACACRGADRVRSVLRPSAWSAGLRFLPRKLKAEVGGTEPRKDALRVTSKEPTADFADFADEVQA